MEDTTNPRQIQIGSKNHYYYKPKANNLGKKWGKKSQNNNDKTFSEERTIIIKNNRTNWAPNVGKSITDTLLNQTHRHHACCPI